MGRFCLDANFFKTGWYIQYRQDVFPSLWGEIATQKSDLVIIQPIFDEIKFVKEKDREKKTRDKLELDDRLKLWIQETEFQIIDIDPQSEEISLSLESKYEIRKQSRGASENDMKLIAYAKNHGLKIVTFEAEQKEKPKKLYNYKIPLICKCENVEWLTFIELLRELNIRI